MDIKDKQQSEKPHHAAENLDNGYGYISLSAEKKHSSTTLRVGFPSWIKSELHNTTK